MAAVEGAEDEIAASLTGREEQVAIAAINGPDAVVVSGDEDAVAAIAELWSDRGRRVKRLVVSHAFHSPRMEPMLAEFGRSLEGIELAQPRIPVVSNVSGELAGEEIATAGYWVRHVREAVRFMDGVGTLAAKGVSRYLELGPDGVLTALAETCLAAAGGEDAPADRSTFATVLRGDRPEPATLLAALGAVHVAGADVDWSVLFAGTEAKRVPLPTYAFQRERFWVEVRAAAGDVSAAGLGTADHPLLGASVALAGADERLLTGLLSLEDHPWLSDHVSCGALALPGAVLAELALAAGEEVGCRRVERLTLEEPLVLASGGAVQLQVAVGAPGEDGRRELALYSRPRGDGEWSRHARGAIVPAATDAAAAVPELAVWPPEDADPLSVEAIYDAAAGRGLVHGPAFQGVRAAWRRGEELFAEVELGEDQAGDAGRFGIHPALLDAALHCAGDDRDGDPLMPAEWRGMTLDAAGANALRVRVVPSGDGIALAAVDATGMPVLSVETLVREPLDRAALAAAAACGAGAADAGGTSAPPAARQRRVAAGSLRGRLDSTPEAERDAVALEIVAGIVAAVLGFASADAVEPDKTFLEMGVDSLGALQLRNRLGQASGLTLAPTLAFDQPTPRAVALHLTTLLTRTDAAAAEVSAAGQGSGTLTALVRHASADGKILEAIGLLAEAAKFRPAFASAGELPAQPPRPPLTAGEAPRLICLPSFVAGAGPFQFARFAQSFAGRRSVSALSLPGFADGEPVPASWSAAIEALAASVRAVAGGDPVVLLGHSAGGMLAHAIAEWLEDEGDGPAGVVLIDTYATQGDEWNSVMASAMAPLFGPGMETFPLESSLLTMGAYWRLIPEWEPRDIAAPGLFLRAAQPLGDAYERGLLPAWQLPETILEVPGDHFGVIGDRAESTARAVDEWLAEKGIG